MGWNKTSVIYQDSLDGKYTCRALELNEDLFSRRGAISESVTESIEGKERRELADILMGKDKPLVTIGCSHLVLLNK